MHTLPTALPLWVGEKASQNSSIQIALAFEITIEPAVRQARTGHDLAQRYALKAILIKQLACAVDDPSLYCRAMTSGIRHLASSFSTCRSMPRKGFTCPPKYDLEHI